MKPLQVESLTKHYGSTVGAEDITFAVEQGEVFGYLGPNGSGKTTTIRCIMGLLRPTRGKCYVLSQRIRHGHATRHAQIGYLPGDFKLWPQFTARKALELFASLGDNKAAQTRREQLAERLGLDLGRRIGQLSKGNRQKAGIIYAFQHLPQLLILDEPTIGLDPLVRQTVLDLIREATDEGATILLSSHDLAEVAAVCSRAAILRRGRLVELSPISQIVRHGRRRLKVWFADTHDADRLTTAQPREVNIVHQQAGMVEISYKGAAENVLKWLSQFSVDRIATEETSLQDAFIQYYRDDPSSRGDIS